MRGAYAARTYLRDQHGAGVVIARVDVFGPLDCDTVVTALARGLRSGRSVKRALYQLRASHWLERRAIRWKHRGRGVCDHPCRRRSPGTSCTGKAGPRSAHAHLLRRWKLPRPERKSESIWPES